MTVGDVVFKPQRYRIHVFNQEMVVVYGFFFQVHVTGASTNAQCLTRLEKLYRYSVTCRNMNKDWKKKIKIASTITGIRTPVIRVTCIDSTNCAMEAVSVFGT